MKQLKGLGRVFYFTFRQQTRTPGYRSLTAVIAALCLLVPILVLGVMGARADREPDVPEYIPEDTWELPDCSARSILVQDETENPITDWSFLQALHPEGWDMGYTHDEVFVDTIVLTLTKTDGLYQAQVSLPEGTSLTQEDLAAYEMFLWENFPAILQVKSGLTTEQLAAISVPIEVGRIELLGGEDPLRDMKEVLGAILPYLGVMIMYFLVLFYGQGVANSVLLEKTSKLMDFFLVSVEPAAMVLGKVLAIAAAGLLQLGLWLLSLAGGFAVGAALCRSIAPQAQFGILTFFESLSLFEGRFSLPAIALAVGIVLGGFLLYCARAGVGGALAGKAEDLSSTNVLFSLTLVASFLICLLGGSGDAMDMDALFAKGFVLNGILVLPALMILVLAAFRVKVKQTLTVSAVIAAVLAVAIQKIEIFDLVKMMLFGYETEVPELAAMMNGGGVSSMVRTAVIVGLSSSFSGIFEGTGLLNSMKQYVAAISEKATPFGATFLVSIMTSMVACNQMLAAILSHQLCRDIEPDAKEMAIYLEDTVIVMAPLIPWSIAGAVPLATVGAPMGSIALAFYLYLLPLWKLGLHLKKGRK